MIGQRQGGFLNFAQQAVGRCASHIWFERTEAKDRQLVRKKLQAHVNDESKLPILIFPEGTCINNSSVMLFKKGSFEASFCLKTVESANRRLALQVADVVYPIAMKYDNRLGDAFWVCETTRGRRSQQRRGFRIAANKAISLISSA